LFKVKKKSDSKSWKWELEKNIKGKPYMFEASSPQGLRENETEIAIAQSDILNQYFSKHPSKKALGGKPNPWEDDPPGLHVHVMSKCLLEDVRRLVAVLLIWERFDEAIYRLTGTTLHTGAASLKAASVSKKSKVILDHLFTYITKDGWSDHEHEELGSFFMKHESASDMDGDKTDADGFRRFEVNVCHLLHVKCAHKLPQKNRVPKFGALEFRGFDPNVGEPLRLIILLVERLVQFACTSSLGDGGKLHKLAYWDPKDGKPDSVSELFEALDITKDVPSDKFKREFFMEAGFAQKDT